MLLINENIFSAIPLMSVYFSLDKSAYKNSILLLGGLELALSLNMDFKELADVKILHEKTLAAARGEKAATFHLLECLHLVDERRAYLELGHATIFAYVHLALGYSEGQAFERIQAMRLAFRSTEIREALRDGTLTMTSIAKLATHARREKLAPAAVVELSQEIAHKSVRETERALASRATVAVTPKPRLVPVSSKEFRLDLTLDAECAELLREGQRLDADPGVAMAVVLKRALKMYVEKRRQRKYGERLQESPAAGVGESRKSAKQPLIVSGERSKGRPHIPTKLRRAAFARAENQCEFRSLVTGERCKETTALELDHKFPLALGGGNGANLQVLCKSHNGEKNMRVVDEFG